MRNGGGKNVKVTWRPPAAYVLHRVRFSSSKTSKGTYRASANCCSPKTCLGLFFESLKHTTPRLKGGKTSEPE